jgi:CBS domain-containing protein
MRREIKICREDESLRVAAERMLQGGCGSLAVVSEHGKVVAFVTDRDLCMGLCRQGLAPATTPVSTVASPHVLVVHEDDSSEIAQGIMRRHHVRRLPVVDRAGRPVGIVSVYDLAKQAHWAGSKGDRLTPESVITTEIAIGQRGRQG